MHKHIIISERNNTTFIYASDEAPVGTGLEVMLQGAGRVTVGLRYPTSLGAAYEDCDQTFVLRDGQWVTEEGFAVSGIEKSLKLSAALADI